MTQATSSFSLLVPVAAIKILDKNPYRLLYSIQNLDAANYIALGKTGVTAGAFLTREGQHLVAGQPMSDDTDKDEVWACANTAPVVIVIIEISNVPPSAKKGNPRTEQLRGVQPRELRMEARTF